MKAEKDEIKGGEIELSSDISIITAEINTYKRVAGEAIFEIGRRLKHVKENDLAHGEWERWCRDDAKISPTNAKRYIRVFNRFGEKRPPGVGLGLRIWDELTPFTDEELEQEHELPSGEKKKPTEMSRREIEELKRQLFEPYNAI